MTDETLPTIERLTLTVLPGGKACLFLCDATGDRGVAIDGLPPLERVEVLKAWALESLAELRRSDDAIGMASAFRETLVERADAWHGVAPLWYGWAISEAFRAGYAAARVKLTDGETKGDS